MSDLDLDLLRAWTPEPVSPSAEVREHARAQLQQQYGGAALTPTLPAPVARRFGKRFAIATIAAAVLLAAAIVVVQRQVDDRVDQLKTVTVPKGALSDGAIGHGPVNILVVGSDTRTFVGPSPATGSGARSDTIILLRIDEAGVRALWIPRDLAIGTGSDRINSTFATGPTGLIDAIKRELDVEIDHYVEVDFSGFERIVNELGGVPVYVPSNARDVYSGVDLTGPSCRPLNGTQALSWVRSRHLEFEQNGVWGDANPRGDLDREARQQSFMRSLAARAQSKVDGDPVAAVRLADALIPALTIDSGFTRSEVFGLVRALVGVDPESLHLATVPVEPAPDGARVLLQQPDADAALAPFRGGQPPTEPAPAPTTSDPGAAAC